MRKTRIRNIIHMRQIENKKKDDRWKQHITDYIESTLTIIIKRNDSQTW